MQLILSGAAGECWPELLGVEEQAAIRLRMLQDGRMRRSKRRCAGLERLRFILKDGRTGTGT